jgi:hypothetical protein
MGGRPCRGVTLRAVGGEGGLHVLRIYLQNAWNYESDERILCVPCDDSTDSDVEPIGMTWRYRYQMLSESKH